MKRNIAKNTLSFMTSKSYKFIRTPLDIWKQLSNEFDFTLDACASGDNHLLPKYYTKENSCLDKIGQEKLFIVILCLICTLVIS